MSDRTREVILDLCKFALTGLVAFFSSCAYTNYATNPAHNINLVPLFLDDDPACVVSAEERMKAVESNRPTPVPVAVEQYTAEFKPGEGEQGWRWEFHRKAGEPPPTTDEYGSYLQSLTTNYIIQKLTAPNLLQRLQADGVVKCPNGNPTAGAGAEAGRRRGELPKSLATVLRVHGILVLDDPSAYAVKRDCRLSMDGKTIPVRAYNQLTSLVATDGDLERTLSFEKSATIFFKYDPSMAPEGDARDELDDAIDALVRAKESRREYPLSVTCNVISAKGGVIAVGGRDVSFLGSALKDG